MSTWRHIESDLKRITDHISITLLIKNLLLNYTFRYLFFLRLASFDQPIASFIGRFFHKRLSRKYGIFIPYKTRIGFGLYLGHPVGIAVNVTTIVGDNVNISQGVTIGSNHQNGAVIGDRVYLGPNVCLVENVTIGDGVTIGAGSVVVKDIPSGATAVGNPAKVISYDGPGRFINKQYDRVLK